MESGYLMMRISQDLKRLLKERAEQEHRDMTGHVLHLVEKDLKENGFLPETTQPQPSPEPQH